MSDDQPYPLRTKVRTNSVRMYRIALAISVVLNVLLVLALYWYSTVEGFMSMMGMAMGLLT